MTTYKDAGVDIDAAESAKKSMKDSIDRGDGRVLNRLGAFASLVDGSFPGYQEPVLVLKMEEPGTKQKLAFKHGYVRSICFDTINHLINDIAVMGAVPHYAQDLIICGKLEEDVVTEIVQGFADACEEQGCVLTGGETTEQPGVLEPGTYALGASVIGIVEKSKIIDGSSIEEGNSVLAIASNGLHTNGYTLARTLMDRNPDLAEKDIDGTSYLDAIMQPHTCYFKALRGLFDDDRLHGLAHITGGGMEGNINRILPDGMTAAIDLGTIQIPPIFRAIKEAGTVTDSEMLRTFNMGVGIAAVIDDAAVQDIQTHLEKHGHRSFIIGTIKKGTKPVVFEGTLGW